MFIPSVHFPTCFRRCVCVFARSVFVPRPRVRKRSRRRQQRPVFVPRSRARKHSRRNSGLCELRVNLKLRVRHLNGHNFAPTTLILNLPFALCESCRRARVNTGNGMGSVRELNECIASENLNTPHRNRLSISSSYHSENGDTTAAGVRSRFPIRFRFACISLRLPATEWGLFGS